MGTQNYTKTLNMIVVISVSVWSRSRTTNIKDNQYGYGRNDQASTQENMFVEKLRGIAIHHILKYKEYIKQRYDKCIKKYDFIVGDWVLQRVTRESKQGKLDDNWPMSYIMGKIRSNKYYIMGTLEVDC